MIIDAELAWLLAEVARPCLNRRQRQMIFVDLGSGEEIRAIERILRAVNRARFVLPPAAVTAVEQCLSRYTDSGCEPRLRPLVDQVRRGATVQDPDKVECALAREKHGHDTT